MKNLTTILISATVSVLLLTGCGTADSVSDPAPADPPESQAELLAVALEYLVEHDHTFGQGPPPFSEYLIDSAIDPNAGVQGLAAPESGDSTADALVPRELTTEERAAIEEIVGEFGPVRWIDDRAEWITPDLAPTIEGAVILGVGEPEIDGDTALVPVSMWCSGLCGFWATYRVDLVDGTWTVRGSEGPTAIS